MRKADKDLFESYLAFNESLSNWLYVAGLERVERLKAAAAPARQVDGEVTQTASRAPRKKPRRKR